MAAELSLVSGVEGLSVYLNGYRIAGPKPWGGGIITKTWEVDVIDVRVALDRVTHLPPSVKPKIRVKKAKKGRVK